ncbi:hypothetical protein AAC387_Pa04g1573 [Persea americana]
MPISQPLFEQQPTHAHQHHADSIDPLPHAAAETPPSLEPANEVVVPITNPLPHLQRTHTMRTQAVDGIFKPKTLNATKHPLPKVFQIALALSEPTCFSQAIKSLEWREAMALEFDALHRQGTWTLVPLPSGRHSVECRWVYKIKQRADGTIERYKARLVAKGFHQKPCLDYTNTFSPVVKHTTVRLVISFALQLGWLICQLDVHNAFLYGVLSEEVYMDQPQGFVDPNHPTHVCKLHKSIYGLKQAPREWYLRLTNYLKSLGSSGSSTDTSLFVQNFGREFIILLIYVDDIVVTGLCRHRGSQMENPGFYSASPPIRMQHVNSIPIAPSSVDLLTWLDGEFSLSSLESCPSQSSKDRIIKVGLELLDSYQ